MIYASGATTLSKLAIGAANTVQVSSGSAPSWALLTNSNIDAAAAIAYSKLDLADDIVNADINSAAAIAYSKLNLSNSILNADINSSAAIAYSKLAALTTARALVSDGSGVVSVSTTTTTQLQYLNAATGTTGTTSTNLVFSTSPTLTTPTFATSATFSYATATTVPYLDGSKNLVSSAVTPTELGYVSGVTSAIQTQINTKAPSTSPTFATSARFSYATASTVPYFDSNKDLISSAVTPTQLGYLGSATGTTGTTSTNLVFSASPTFTGTVTLPSGSVSASAWNYGASTFTGSGIASFTGGTASSYPTTGQAVITGGLGVSTDIYAGSTVRIVPGANSNGVFIVTTSGTGNPYLRVGNGTDGWVVGMLQSTGAFVLNYGAGASPTSGTTTLSATTGGLVTIGASGGTQTHVINGNQSTTGTLAVTGNSTLTGIVGLGGSPNAVVGCYLQKTGMTGATVWGFNASQVGSGDGGTGAMTGLVGFASGCTTSNLAFTLATRWGFRNDNTVKGAASTITRDIAFGGTFPTQGTNNAMMTDNTAFTGNWFINQSGSAANLLTGPTAIGGTTTNDNASAGQVGEYIASSQSSFTNMPNSTGQWGDGPTIALTAGDWDVTVTIAFTHNSAGGLQNFTAGIGATSGNTSPGNEGEDFLKTQAPSSGNNTSVCFSKRVSLSGSATYYTKLFSSYTSGNPQYAGRIFARRVR
jgi:hypothetical protein